MEHVLRVSYQTFTQDHSLSLCIHGADHQGLTGNHEVGSYLCGPTDEQGVARVPHENWCGTPCAPANNAPLCGETSAYLAGATPGQRPDLLHLHAPVPMLGRPPLLRSNSYYSSEVRISAREELSVPHFTGPDKYQSIIQVGRSYPPPPQSITPSQSTFLTPSELLVELSNDKTHPEPPSPRTCPDCDDFTPEASLLATYTEYSVMDTMTTPNSSFAALTPNDSDTTQEAITPHEKKRYYLECLEHYVIFLHEHCRLIGFEPPSLERISSYPGLNSRSIRSLLIHMEKLDKQMKERILQEEQRFVRLRDALQQQEATIQAAHGVPP